ncbi:MAG: Fur family transcriptional regulator [bacterium]|nr:Fur family transcriptional regulator [bacterium]
MRKNPEFQSLLRKSGYKATSSRMMILAVFRRLRHPLSAQEIIDSVGKAMDQATVYRTLTALKTKGIIRQVDLRHNHAHFELANAKEHHHLICLRCGRIEDISGCGIEELQSGILRKTKHFSEIRQHSLEFYGICKSCARGGGMSSDLHASRIAELYHSR